MVVFIVFNDRSKQESVELATHECLLLSRAQLWLRGGKVLAFRIQSPESMGKPDETSRISEIEKAWGPTASELVFLRNSDVDLELAVCLLLSPWVQITLIKWNLVLFFQTYKRGHFALAETSQS